LNRFGLIFMLRVLPFYGRNARLADGETVALSGRGYRVHSVFAKANMLPLKQQTRLISLPRRFEKRYIAFSQCVLT